jgi:hypothetical protein
MRTRSRVRVCYLNDIELNLVGVYQHILSSAHPQLCIV